MSSPEGAFYVNQDADLNAHDHQKPFIDGHVFYALDDEARRKLGVPWVDTHVYARAKAIAARMRLHFGGGPSGALFDHTADPDAQGVFQRRLASFTHNVTAARLLNAVGDPGTSLLAAVGANERIDNEGAWVGEFLLAGGGL